MKNLLKQLARRCGLVVVSAGHAGRTYLEHPPRTMLDRVLLGLYPSLQGLRFIQVGANDGRRADPLQRYVDHCGWTGVMLEPLARNFADLQAHRGGNPRLRLWRAAVDLTAGRRPLYDLAPAALARLPDWTGGLASFSRDRVVGAARELGLPESAVVAEEIETVTWADVWRAAGSGRCDLLVLDTEGYDITLLRAAGLAQHRPRVVMFEHGCVPDDERFAFYRELIALGYEIATDAGDTIAHLPA